MRRIASVGVMIPSVPCTALASSAITQTSFDSALRGNRPASASSSDKARARPPGNARQRVPSNVMNIRSAMGFASSPFGPAHGASDGLGATDAA